MNLVKTQINLSDLTQGMTVEYKGELLTVSKNDIKQNSFFGYSFRGDSSSQKITMIQFKVQTNKGTILR